MPKFSEVAAGVRARRPATLPLPGAVPDGETGGWTGPTVPLHLRALAEPEYDDVLEFALKFAKKRGLENPEDGDAIYERGKMLQTLAFACINADSPEEDPQPFFDEGVPQILARTDVMTPEVIAYLYEHQQIMQEVVSPLRKDMTPSEFMIAAAETAKGNLAFFVNTRPGMRWTFVRILASRYIDSLANRSPSTPSSEPQTTIPSSESSSRSKNRRKRRKGSNG